MADKIDKNPFFMVYVQGERQPQFIHEDYDNAVFEVKYKNSDLPF